MTGTPTQTTTSTQATTTAQAVPAAYADTVARGITSALAFAPVWAARRFPRRHPVGGSTR
ncbi:hypothetical protein ACFZAE_20730 [Streptomyces scabiei]|uniref:hypothetical protein n=1 Tax=Streptomyces scabiei TaxID=1930 RepID=UPI0036E71E4F